MREEGSAYRDMDPIIELNRRFIESRFARAENAPSIGIEPLRAAIAASKLSPHELSFTRRELVEALIEAERYDEAIAEAAVVLEIIPTEPELNLLSARARLQIGQQEEAIENLEVFFDVMRHADDGHPRVAEAKRLYDRVVPRS
jgi:tetratricopeptide (TPR) repeat protein